jgi:hypothetical protein
MSPYKKFIEAAKEYFEGVPALKFLLSIYIVVFAVGGLLFLIGSFVTSFLICLGTILMCAGLILTLIKEDMMTLVITSAAISFLSLVAWILLLVGAFTFGYPVFLFDPLFYFLAFGAIAVLVFLKSEKFREMRAAAAKPAGIPCPRCGGIIPFNAAFCPQCAAPNPGPPQYAPPAAPQYAPPAAPQYAPPAAPQYAPPVASQYAPPVAPQPETAPAEPASAAPAVNACVNCGAELPVGAAFCGKCGSKQ